MLTLDRQERLRRRYKAMTPGYRPGLEVYTEMMGGLVGEQTLLLDAGCGPGGLVKRFAGIAARVIGVDRYVSSFADQAEIATLVEADLNALPFPSNSFTLVTCSWVLEHLPDPPAVFREFRRVLKPGGHIIFITPNKRHHAVWMRRLVPSAISQRVVHAIYARDEHFINPTFYRANTYGDIDGDMTRSGLRCVRFEHVGDPTYLALNEPLFRLSVAVERLLDRFSPQRKVHLVGLYQKP